jgi:hypothetical protein
MKRLSVLLGLGVAVVSMLPTTASAATVVRQHVSHGTANCQSALPVFDGNIRKRPMAFANEGATNAFVTCGTESISNTGSGFSFVGVVFVNRAGAADVEVSCTLVDGVLMASGYFTKSANVGAGGVNFIQWSGVDENAGENFSAPALSCNLPSGVDIGMVMFEYPEEIGTAAP